MRASFNQSAGLNRVRCAASAVIEICSRFSTQLVQAAVQAIWQSWRSCCVSSLSINTWVSVLRASFSDSQSEGRRFNPDRLHLRRLVSASDTGRFLLTLRECGIRSVAIPALGCGLGGLDWDLVRREIECAMAPLRDVDVQVFRPMATESETVERDSDAG